MEIHLEIIGIILILLSCIHPFFPRYFSWKEDFEGVSVINRQMMYVHTLFIAVVLLLMGLLCFYTSVDLLHTQLGHYILLGLALFWTLRLVVQFIGFSPELWKGKRFETTVHIIFSLLWIYFSFVFWAAFSSWK